eukprot:354175-Chlamydomonas_euryale.AAC.3
MATSGMHDRDCACGSIQKLGAVEGFPASGVVVPCTLHGTGICVLLSLQVAWHGRICTVVPGTLHGTGVCMARA